MIRRLLLAAILFMAANSLWAQSISYIERSGAWYYIYDENGKKIKTISASQGEIVAHGTSFYILKQGKAFYITYDAQGRRLHTFGASSVGEVVGASGDTFTSKLGVWLYTWSKDGRKLNTRSASSSH